MHKWVPYRKDLKYAARDLRNNSTLGEVLLWKQLKGKQTKGYDFHRQKPILTYVVDFYCPALRLVIEVDGGYHNEEEVAKRDKERQGKIENLGIEFLRFTDKEIRYDMQSVLMEIDEWITDFENRSPDPLSASGASH